MAEYYSGLFAGAPDEYQQDFDRGDPYALLQAIDACGQRGVPIPKWAADALHEKLRLVYERKLFSWDEVFGAIGPPPGKHRKKLTTHAENFQPVNSRIRELKAQGRAIDNALFEEVGAEFGIGAKVCKELYYEMGDTRRRATQTVHGETGTALNVPKK